jgi:DNA-binding transcriptional ArsR family regulator
MPHVLLERACHALGDPTRRAILDRLRERERPAGELARGFPISRPAVSQHLRVLREAGLVAERRDGRRRLYRLEPAPLAELDAWLAGYRAFWSARLHDLKRVAEAVERGTQETETR